MDELRAGIRSKNTHHEAKKTRRTGNVPGILYGKGLANLMFEIGELELNSVISSQGEHGIVNLNLGGEEYKTLIKEIQRDPVTGKVVHIDLEDIKGGKKVIATVPIHFIGEDLVSKRGAIVQKEKNSVKVKCSADSLPKYVELDLSNAQVGNQFKLSDVEFASELSILDDIKAVLASITYEQKITEAVEKEASNTN